MTIQAVDNMQAGTINTGSMTTNGAVNQNSADNFAGSLNQGFGGIDQNTLSLLYSLISQLIQQLQAQYSQCQAGTDNNMEQPTSTSIPQSTADAFNNLTGGSDLLTSEQLVGAVNGVAGEDRAFDSHEFQQLGSALGLTAEQSSNVFNALSAGSGSIPADAVIDFASQRADANGNWNIQQFNDVVSSLPGLSQSNADDKY